jgi:hypothetical protein
MIGEARSARKGLRSRSRPRRRRRPRFLANGVLKYWSIGVLRLVRIATRDREVEALTWRFVLVLLRSTG